MIINKTQYMANNRAQDIANNKAKKIWTKKTFSKKKPSLDLDSCNLMKSVSCRTTSVTKMESKSLFFKTVTMFLLFMLATYAATVFYGDNYIFKKNKPLTEYLKEISALGLKLYQFAISMFSGVQSVKLDEKVLHSYLLVITGFFNAFFKLCFDFIILVFIGIFNMLTDIIKELDKNSPIYIEQFMKITNITHNYVVDFMIDVSNYVKNKVFV